MSTICTRHIQTDGGGAVLNATPTYMERVHNKRLILGIPSVISRDCPTGLYYMNLAVKYVLGNVH